MAINTLFQNIADAIRAKAGTSGLITPAQMPAAIAAIQSGLETISRADWNALTPAQKKEYGLIGIIDSVTGFTRGTIVNGADFTEYLPYSVNTILAQTGTFTQGESKWGDFTWNNNTLPYENADGSVNSNGSAMYYNLGAANTSCTIYQIAKSSETAGVSRRWLDVSYANSYGNACCFFRNGTNVKVSTWGLDPIILSNGANAYSVQAMIVDRMSGSTTFKIKQGNTSNIETLSPTNTGSVVYAGGGMYESESNIDVIYAAVVQGAETVDIVEANMINLLSHIPN